MLKLLRAELTGRPTEKTYLGLKVTVTDPDDKVQCESTTTGPVEYMVTELERKKCLDQLKEKFPATYLQLLYKGLL